jgi:thioredoxin 1
MAISNIDDFYKYISSNGMVVIDFYSRFCQPCIQFLKIFERVENALLREGVIIEKIETNDNKDITDIFGITIVPVFIIFKDGKEVHRYFGVKPIAEMVKIIQTLK